MKVIFLKDVPRVGRKNDIKEVSDGYAVNFLLPRKLVEPATPKNIAELEQRKKEIVIQKEIQEDLLIRNLEEIRGKKVFLKTKADEKGRLFASIHKKEIIEAMYKEHRIDLGEDFIILEKPLKQIGEFDIPVEINKKGVSFKLVIERE